MSKAKKRSAQKAIDFSDEVVYGNEGKEIVRYAENKNFDILVIGSRGQSGLKEAFLGSTSNYVLHKIQIPIMIVK